MAAKRRGIVVYHGTLVEQAPHRVPQPEGIFHAGTRKSAIDRLQDQEALQPGDEYLDVAQPQIHVYEIEHDAPMSMMHFSDPIYEGSSALDAEGQEVMNNVPDWVAMQRHKKYSSEELQVNRGDVTKRIKKYTNIVEDPGSTSYQIPANLVSTKVRHLGAQFHGYNPDVEDPSSDVELVPGDPDWWQYKRQKGKN